MGVVFRARDTHLDREVAVKLLADRYPAGSAVAVRFLEEARRLKLGEPLDPLAVFEGVAQAVGYARSRGVVHRDLKPAKVMVGAFGEVQVIPL